MNNSNEVSWDDGVWKEINDAVLAEVQGASSAEGLSHYHTS